MSQMIDFTLPSCQPGRTLHAFRCVPEGEVRAVLQLSHGMVEYRDRKAAIAQIGGFIFGIYGFSEEK